MQPGKERNETMEIVALGAFGAMMTLFVIVPTLLRRK
jgi:hypothetical protein